MITRSIVVRLVGLASVAAAAACRDGGPTTGPAPVSLVQTRQAPAPDIATLTRQIPGFGGVFIDHGVPTVYLTDLTQRDRAVGLLRAFARSRGLGDIRVLQARFAYGDLDRWFQDISYTAFEQGNVVFVDLDEAANRVLILLLLLSSIPVVAGLQINFPGFLCTLGFNAVSNGQNSFVTASHCTTTQGGVEGTQYWQSLSSQPNSFIGTEVADPQYFRGKGKNSPCPKGRRCRYSDSARAAYAAGVLFTLGGIAQTSGPNNGSLDITGNFSIGGEGGEVAGDVANKVGRTTGWTQGVITNTCVDVGVSGTNIVQLCQNLVTAGVGAGDSGSDVFFDTGSGVNLLGILWGGNGAGTHHRIFAAWSWGFRAGMTTRISTSLSRCGSP